MSLQMAAPWHRASYDALLTDSLPRLLAARVPLASYSSEPVSKYACRIRILLATRGGEWSVDLPEVPQPDEDGVFEIAGQRYVVLPLASKEALDEADVRCVGEQLYDHMEQRLGEAPADLAWDANLARAWLPIDAWIRAFVQASQSLDETNWLARCEHLRRISIPDRKELFHPGQVGRTCPIETPEGTNIGRILHVAAGAEIRDRKLVVTDPSPAASLSAAASMVPFLEHSDSNRLLMGVNMMRQWLPGGQVEPALVRTGSEPDVPEFWCGRNLLTAFVSWGGQTHEDAIVISESAAARMDQGGRPLEVGDKISNRHGTKGVISRILPDDRMPHLPDGTPVDLVFSWIGLHTRLNFGQQREALMGRIAKSQGKPALVRPFEAPAAQQLREAARSVGLPTCGMETLRDGKDGPALQMPSLAGWVYWGKTLHLAADKIHSTVSREQANMQGEMEYLALRAVGATALIDETFNTRATTRPGAVELAGRIAAGESIELAGPPSPNFARTVASLEAAGIRAELAAGPEAKLTFRFAPPSEPLLKLARPVPHPWVPERELAVVGLREDLPESGPLREANDRLRRLQDQKAPPAMLERAAEQLRERLNAYLGAMFPAHWRIRVYEPPMAEYTWATNHLARNVRVLFSGRTVIAAGTGLRIDQVGLAEEIAWTMFGPFVDRQLGAGAAATRSEEATATLDAIMADKWILLNRAPSIMPTSILAFHAVRIPEKVIRLHPLTNMLLNADYDGDQAAVFLPITEAGQREAAEKLSVAGHLRRDPSLLRWLMPSHASLWGLARLSLTQAGRERIDGILGVPVETPEGFLTRSALEQASRVLLQRAGAERTLAALDELVWLGFDESRRSGASMSPFIGTNLVLPEPPRTDDPDAWDAYSGQIAATLGALADFADPDLGPQVLAVRCGARGGLRHLVNLLGSRGTQVGLDGKPLAFRHGWSEGLTPQEMRVHAMHARAAMGEVALAATREAYGIREASPPPGLGVLVRAMRAERPGVVFARAALAGEVDFLTDLDSRLSVGLPVS